MHAKIKYEQLFAVGGEFELKESAPYHSPETLQLSRGNVLPLTLSVVQPMHPLYLRLTTFEISTGV
jgi:hypothetical protein